MNPKLPCILNYGHLTYCNQRMKAAVVNFLHVMFLTFEVQLFLKFLSPKCLKFCIIHCANNAHFKNYLANQGHTDKKNKFVECLLKLSLYMTVIFIIIVRQISNDTSEIILLHSRYSNIAII